MKTKHTKFREHDGSACLDSWAKEAFLGPCGNGQNNHTADGSDPSQFTQAAAAQASDFLGCDQRENADVRSHHSLHALASTKVGEETSRYAVLSAQKLSSSDSIYFFLFLNSNSSFLMTSSSSPNFPKVGVDVKIYFSLSNYYSTHTMILLAWGGSPVARETRSA